MQKGDGTQMENDLRNSFLWVLNELGYFPDPAETTSIVSPQSTEGFTPVETFLDKAKKLDVIVRHLPDLCSSKKDLVNLLKEHEVLLAFWLDDPCSPIGTAYGYFEVAIFQNGGWMQKPGIMVPPCFIDLSEINAYLGKPHYFAIEKRTP